MKLSYETACGNDAPEAIESKGKLPKLKGLRPLIWRIIPQSAVHVKVLRREKKEKI